MRRHFGISLTKKAKNICVRKIIEEINYYTARRFTTLAGTLVYFLLMSITPFLFWVALLVGKFDLSRFLPQTFYSVISPVVGVLQNLAFTAADGTSIFLVVTSLWSSTNFFYHLRRIGELLFSPQIKTNSVKLRIHSLLSVFGILFIIAFSVATPFLGESVLKNVMPRLLAEAITVWFLIVFAYLAACFLNAFACPYGLKYSQVCGGALLTLTAWVVCSVGFSIYLQYASPHKLYGAVTAVIVFTLWCYLMINSLIIGIIYNARYSVGKSVLNATSARKRTGTDMAGNA